MKKRVSYNISKDLLEKLDSISRNELPNKSLLVEQLLEKWLESRKLQKKM
jgi:metal-responsive CopG/Arc/MetJ family transcriptional regulator